jgi:hypothetical protein
MRRQLQIMTGAYIASLLLWSATARKLPGVKTVGPNGSRIVALIVPPAFAASGYSLIYLLGGGDFIGAIVIFFIAQKCWMNEFRQKYHQSHYYEPQPKPSAARRSPTPLQRHVPARTFGSQTHPPVYEMASRDQVECLNAEG